MLEFYAAPFMATMTDLGRAIRALDDIEGGHGPANWAVNHALSCLERDLPRLPLSPVVRHQFGRLQEAALDAKTTTPKMRTLLYEFETNLWIDLKQHSYFLVPASHRPYFETPDLFGPTVAQQFPNAEYDIQHAGRCIAFDEWTATVFHLMRVVEYGLRYVANDIGLVMSPEQDEQWKTLIDRMLSEIGKLEGTEKTPEKAERLKFYSAIGLDLRNFKNAWRNEVSHARANYDQDQAMKIWNHVRGFMQAIAVRIAR